MKSNYLTVKMEPELKAKLAEMAKKERRSLADETAYLMEIGLRLIERQAEPVYTLPEPSPVMGEVVHG